MKLANIFTNLMGGAESYQAQLVPPPVMPKNIPADPLAPHDARDLMDEDQVVMSKDAAYYLAARDYDPTHMTPSDNRRLADLLHDAGAISARDHAILLDAPRSRSLDLSSDLMPRNFLADWQMKLAGSMGSSNVGSVHDSTRALSILGRISSARADLS